MASSVSPAGTRETLWVRIRRRSLAEQLAFAGGVLAIVLLAAYFLFSGRGETQAPPPGPTPVGVMVVTEQPVTLSTELPGRTAPYETSDVRPQVDGIIRARLFTEGDYVREGQPLYRIDPSAYEARVASARAALAKAQASTIGAEGQVRRYRELLKRNFVSRQNYDDAVSAAGAARADVAAQRAAVRSAEIDLARTTIRAPISGRIGRSLYTTGALVHGGPGESADHDPAARPDLRRYPAVELGPASASRTSAFGPGRQRPGARPPDARKRFDVSVGRNLALRRSDRRPGHRLADHPRNVPQPAAAAASRNVRSGPAGPGRSDAGHDRSATGRQPRRARPADGPHGRARTIWPSSG